LLLDFLISTALSQNIIEPALIVLKEEITALDRFLVSCKVLEVDKLDLISVVVILRLVHC
jgi:hypothetical protein